MLCSVLVKLKWMKKTMIADNTCHKQDMTKSQRNDFLILWDVNRSWLEWIRDLQRGVFSSQNFRSKLKFILEKQDN